MNSEPRPSFELHDVRDLFAFVWSRVSNREAFLRLTDQEDCVGFLVEAVIREEPNFNPEKGKFSTFVGKIVSDRFKDYLRANVFDDRNHERHSLDVSSVHDLVGDCEGDPWSHVSVYLEDEEDVDEHDLLARVPLERLSAEAQDTLFSFALPLRRGSDLQELAELHGTTPRTINARLQRLRLETSA